MRRASIALVPGALLCAALGFSAQAQTQFNGGWRVTRSIVRDCGEPGSVFNITIRNGVVTAPGGRGSVNAAGRITFPGVANVFTGHLKGNAGSGSYKGRCTGTFTARRR
jgi:hypothetical protein